MEQNQASVQLPEPLNVSLKILPAQADATQSTEGINNVTDNQGSETNTELQQSEKQTIKHPDSYVAMIIDRSGSMMSMGDQVMNGFNEFVDNQKEEKGLCHATVVSFDNTVEVVHHAVPISAVPHATKTTFKPRGGTALCDAIVSTVVQVEDHIMQMPAKHRTKRVMIMILTDGHENSSHCYSHKDVVHHVQRLEKEKGWEFVFLGANQDAVTTGAQYGMKDSNCLTFTASAVHSKKAFECMSAMSSRYRSGQQHAFTPVERAATVDKHTNLMTMASKFPPDFGRINTPRKNKHATEKLKSILSFNHFGRIDTPQKK